MENVNGFKVAVTAIAAGVSAVLGWFGWLVVAFVACLTGDWISGSAVASITVSGVLKRAGKVSGIKQDA